ncbi:MAG: hypothetical protein LC723_12815, partial [Actinobacteria bacterium]|nr:hypothetical protein [Actinomycetota bacterium]
QDLSVEPLKVAARCGVRVSLGTDSHHHSQLGYIAFGLAAAALAGLPKERVVNFMTLPRLHSWVKSLRQR